MGRAHLKKNEHAYEDKFEDEEEVFLSPPSPSILFHLSTSFYLLFLTSFFPLFLILYSFSSSFHLLYLTIYSQHSLSHPFTSFHFPPPLHLFFLPLYSHHSLSPPSASLPLPPPPFPHLSSLSQGGSCRVWYGSRDGAEEGPSEPSR